MNFKFILMLCLFRTYEVVLSMDGAFECVKRKSGACKAFNVSLDFDHFIDLKTVDDMFNTIIEIDYMENKYSYEQDQHKKKGDSFENPVVEILFSEDQDPEYSYRLVLGEKLNRLAYLEVVDEGHTIKYNNYSPDLPAWPFAVNVTYDGSKLMVNTRNGDGFDKSEPFLKAYSPYIYVKFMSVRNRNKNVKLVSFYDCSTKYGFNCGTEKTESITDCRAKFSPLGSGFFNNFVDMSKYNRNVKEKDNTDGFEFNEIFGIYRRNNDSCVILFSSRPYEKGTYVRITIGDEIAVRVRTYNKISRAYYEKDAVTKAWHQEPSDPNFIRVNISTSLKQISIYNLHATDDDKPILTMKLCNYFETDSIVENAVRYMSVTSNRFKNVDLYYDCCLPDKLKDCHVYEKNDTRTQIGTVKTTDDYQNISDTTIRSEEDSTAVGSEEDSTTLQSEEDSTTLRSEEDSTTLRSEEDSTTLRSEEDSTTVRSEEDSTTLRSEEDYTTLDPNEKDVTTATRCQERPMPKTNDFQLDDEDEIVEELKILNGCEKTKTFLDTSDFRNTTGSTNYVYASGTSTTDYCPSEIEAGVELQQITEATHTADEEESDHQLPSNYHQSPPLNAWRALLG